MSNNPFEAFKAIFPAQPGTTGGEGPWTHTYTPQADEFSEEREVEEESVILTCQVCKEEIERSQVEVGNPWVHSSGRVIFPAGSPLHVHLSHDHEAVPDVIDTTCK